MRELHAKMDQVVKGLGNVETVVGSLRGEVTELKAANKETRGVADAANTTATAALETATNMEEMLAQVQAALEELKSKVDFTAALALDTHKTHRKSHSDTFVILNFSTASDSTPAQLLTLVVNKFQATGRNLLTAASIREVVRLSDKMVKVVCADAATQQKVTNPTTKRMLGRELPADKQIRVGEDLTRADQAHVRRLQPVREYLEKTKSANEKTPFFRAGLLEYFVQENGKQVQTTHQANWCPKLVALAKDQLQAIAAAEAAGQPLPARHAELA